MAEKVTLATLTRMKKQGRPIAMLTCYDYATAVLLQEAGITAQQADDLTAADSQAQVEMDLHRAVEGVDAFEGQQWLGGCRRVGGKRAHSAAACGKDGASALPTRRWPR